MCACGSNYEPVVVLYTSRVKMFNTCPPPIIQMWPSNTASRAYSRNCEIISVPVLLIPATEASVWESIMSPSWTAKLSRPIESRPNEMRWGQQADIKCDLHVFNGSWVVWCAEMKTLVRGGEEWWSLLSFLVNDSKEINLQLDSLWTSRRSF